MIFRLLWISVTVLAVGLFVMGLPARYTQLQVVSLSANTRVGELLPSEAQALVDLGLSPTFYASYFTLLEAISALPFLLVATVLFWRKANERVVFLISITGVLVGTMAIPVTAALVSARPEWEMPVLVLRNVAILGLITQLFVFPDGALCSRLDALGSLLCGPLTCSRRPFSLLWHHRGASLAWERGISPLWPGCCFGWVLALMPRYFGIALSPHQSRGSRPNMSFGVWWFLSRSSLSLF
jgi:hypothetical protein